MGRTEPEPTDRLIELSQAAAAIARAPTLEAALRALAERVRTIVRAEQAVAIITLPDDDARSLSAASFSERYGLQRYRSVQPDGALWRWLCDQPGPVRLDTQELARHPLAAELAALEPAPNGWLVAPLTVRDGRPFGFVLLSDPSDGAFDGRDEAILVQLAQLGSALIENVRLVEQMQRARAEADIASRAKSEFLATMSHEVRTPINAVLGYTELLEIGVSGPLTQTQREHLDRIRNSSLHLLRLVEEVLDLSKIEAGRLVVEEGTHAVTDAVDLALSLVRPQAGARGINLEDHCSERAELSFRGDPDRVRQILVNLLSNAVKFTEPGGHVVLDCDVVSEPPRETRLPPGRYLFVAVADTGLGMTADTLQRIFEPFERGERGHTRRYGGSGLGLSISRRLARVMAGDITVSSKVGAGSTFTLWLPSGDAPRPAVPHRQASAEAPQTIPPELLREAGLALLRALPVIQSQFVAGVRDDGRFDPIRTLPDVIIADHTTTLLADIATCLAAMASSDRIPAPILLDGARVQRLVAERHGEQRARFGLSEDAIHAEHGLLGDLVERTVRECAESASDTERQALAEIARSMIEQAEYSATLAARRARTR